ncbi:transmembrane protein, putative (macronuclear) [Tetrahymena thermophila SB210]|uniref:Transmembrane protein, putative n=1 Tax=Tetrahymena thermophila (strain SB210) TaxID=312017 RepID=Q231G3_TETTS|nr:transmembrane protein, putative [Tetrahymena thermophila SB210]EAR91076.2 transmembrane protein, putative [Tetrahymena thermophila SB210]|eukprot:XP_001011321.2 transmembrane protein, putative [Tetrahymena thermophila SB210]
MKFKNFDLFSSQFKLNISKGQHNKRSCFGGFLSLAVIVISILYFAYLTFQYISNQIEPKYKTQTFLTEDQIQIEFDKDFIGFSYFVNNNTTLQMLEQKTKKVYFVYLSYLLIQDSVDSQLFEIPNFKCTNEKLQGYRCLDVSNLKQNYLSLNAKENSKVNLILTMYRCGDQDSYKKFIPENCAQEEEIDQIVNNDSGHMHIKMFTSQYNTTSKEVQVNYKNVLIYLQGDHFIFTRLKTQKQITTVQQGPFIQYKNSFTSAIDYIQEERALNRETFIKKTGQKLMLQLTVDVLESIVHIKIQYPTFLEVLAIFYSALSVLLGIGAIARYYSKKVIIQDVSLILLQSLYQKTYLELLRSKNLVNRPKIEEESIVLEEDILENQIQAFPVSRVKSLQNPNVQQQSAGESNAQIHQINTERSSKVMFQIGPTQTKVIKKAKKYQKSQSLYVACNPAKQKNKIKQIQVNFIKENKDRAALKKDEIIQNSDFIQESPKFYSQKSILSNRNSQINFFNQNQQDSKDKKQQNCDQNNLFNQKNQIYSLMQQTSNKTFNENQKQDIKLDQAISTKKLDQATSIHKLDFPNKKQFYSQTDSKFNLKSTSAKDLSIDEKTSQKDIVACEEVTNFSHLQSETLSKRLKKIIFSFKLCLRRQQLNPIQSEQGKYKKLQRELLNQIDQQVNLVAIYKDLIFLKKSIMMILSTDQLAAIQLTGTQLNLESDTLNNPPAQNEGKSHLEKQLTIQDCKKHQQIQFKCFLDRIKLNENITETDKRILSSLSV